MRPGSARLVDLCSSETGLTGHHAPDEYIGLPAAFVQAGTACVISALWPVFDDAAYLISRRFYELHLNEDGAERLSPAAALQQAQEWLRDLTFAKLKTMFPIRHDDPRGPYVATGADLAAAADAIVC